MNLPVAVVSLVAFLATATSVPAQVQVQAGAFKAGSQVLFATNFAADSIGSFPSTLTHLKGPLEVVAVNGVRMLRAIGPGEFLIPLGQPLPQDFTLEFDFIPRTGAGHEIAFEGGAVATRSASSAEILWNHQIATVMGGGQGMAQVILPYALQTKLVGQRSTVQVMVTGTQFKLFTNGLQLYNIPNLAFQRANVLRIFLGGVNDASQAMYLAGIRLATNGPASGTASTVATGQPTQPATGTPRTGGTIVTGGPTGKLPLSIVPPATISTAPAAFNQPNQRQVGQVGQALTSQPSGTNFTAGPSQLSGMTWPPGPAFGANGIGIALIWTPVASAASYRVYRAALGSLFPAQPHLAATDPEAAAIAADHAVLGLGANRMLIDPFVDGMYLYWVDAILNDGSISGLSPSYTMVMPPPAVPMSQTIGGVKNLRATFGPSTTVVTWDGKITAPGRTVSWTWDPIAAAPIYEISVQMGPPGGGGGLSPYYETLLTSQPIVVSGFGPMPSVLVPLRSRGYRVGPPFLMGVPSGLAVQFCVGILRQLADPASPGAACDMSVVP